jgi:hypothetical protein
MAVQQQQSVPVRYMELADLPETFADSLHTMVWDGQTLRVELCVTRYPDAAAAGTAAEAKRYPACRLVLTAPVATDLFNRLSQTMSALSQAGVVSQRKAPPKPAVESGQE